MSARVGDDRGRGPASPPAAVPERGGVLLRYHEGEGRTALAFIPAEVASRLASLSALTEVPGTRPPAKGIALADGEVVTVLELGRPPPEGVSRPAYRPDDDWSVPGSDRAVLCELGGQEVAIIGGVVLATGMFDASLAEDGVFWRGELVPTLDVRALYARAETAIWAERAVSSRPSESPSGAPGASSGAGPEGSPVLRAPPLPGVGLRITERPAPSVTGPISSERIPPTAPSPGGDRTKTGGSR
jgi:hypothetical protein